MSIVAGVSAVNCCLLYTSLGFHHIFGGSHYGPGPWENSIRRPDWSPVFYHKADKNGVGFDRTRNGSANVDQYHEPLASQFNSLETCPENLLLWFHHLPWDYKLSSGRELWDEICPVSYTHLPIASTRSPFDFMSFTSFTTVVRFPTSCIL